VVSWLSILYIATCFLSESSSGEDSDMDDEIEDGDKSMFNNF